MKIVHIIFCCLMAGLVCTTPLYGQELQAGVDFQVGLPQGEFKDQLDRGGIGVGFMGGYRFKGSPLMVGLDMGFMNFGSEKRTEPLSTTIPDITVEVVNEYNLFHGDILLRFIPPNPETIIRPFVDGLVGLNYFFTQTTLQERGTAAEVLRDTNFEDTSLNYGFGGGIQIRIYRRGETDKEEKISARSVSLNLMGRYMYGREAEYLQEGSIRRENGEVFFDVNRSYTNLFYIKLGAVINF